MQKLQAFKDKQILDIADLNLPHTIDEMFLSHGIEFFNMIERFRSVDLILKDDKDNCSWIILKKSV